MALANQQDALPTVNGTSDRDLRFPNPATDFKVYDKQSGYWLRWNGTTWDALLQSAAGEKVIDPVNPTYGAAGDGTTDDTAALQAAATAAVAQRAILDLKGRTYVVSSPITVGTSGSPASGVVIRGQPMGWRYFTGSGRAILKASATFPTGESILDLRYATNTQVSDVTVDGSLATAAGRLVAGLELGARTGGTFYSDHRLHNVSLFRCYYGLRARYAGLLRASQCQATGCDYAGFALLEYCGDSDFDGCWANTNSQSASTADRFGGSGFLLKEGTSNVNIRGGKVEFNNKGIYVYASQGVTITGVNFDVNTRGAVTIEGYDTAQLAATSVVVSGNRFLAGGTDGNGSVGYAHVIVYAPNGAKAWATMTGNSCRKGGTAAYDENSTGTVGPAVASVLVMAVGTGDARATVCGNDLLNGSDAASLKCDGALAIAYASGNATNSTISLANGGRVLSPEGNQQSRTVWNFANGDTTPSVRAGSVFACANTGATTITQFDDGEYGQQLVVILDANTTVQHGTAIKLAGGANYVGTANDTLTLLNNNGTWVEVARSVNG